jgi:hypothetical protein
VNSRAEIVAAIQKASSLAEQAELVTLLDQFDANQRRVAAEQRSIDLTDTVVRDTLSPVRVHEMHTASTDWLGNFEASSDEHPLLAEAALWYGRVSPEVKADPEEFLEQARGMMRRQASQYGERAAAVYSTGMEYLAFLNRRQAASGLPQIDQTVAPDGVTSQPTPIPPDVFDNFAPEVNQDNAGVVGTETSERNPLLQEIQSQDGGQGTPEWGHGTWDENWGRTGNPEAPAEEATADDVGDDEYNQFQASVAISHTMTLDDFRAQQAKEAASTLDQIQQTTAPDGVTEKPTPLPGDVMFPWTLGDENPQAEDEAPAQAAIEQAKQAALDDLQGKCPSCDEPVSGMGKVKCGECGLNFERQEKRAVASKQDADPFAEGVGVVKEADMFGNSDAPHAVPQPNVANNPATTPHPEDSAASGKEDASVGNASTTADGTKYPNYSEGFTEGIESLHEQDQHSVPSAMGGDNGTGLGNPKAASLAPKTSALFVTVAAAENADFKRAYAYAAKWTPETPLVKQGSAEFESGLYAGISDNPAQQNAWVRAHRKWAQRVPGLRRRIALHDEFTRRVASKLDKETFGPYLKVEAGTTEDLDTLDPTASPATDGSTPINGIGTPGPLDGGQDAAAPGGPAPYNGVEPFGKPVVPTNAPSATPDPTDQLVNDIPGGPLDGNARALAFRKTVQANLLASKS